MKIILEIPKEFEEHFKDDLFEDSLYRLSIDGHSIVGNYDRELANMLIDAFRNAETYNHIPISWIKEMIPFQSMSVSTALLSMLDSWEKSRNE